MNLTNFTTIKTSKIETMNLTNLFYNSKATIVVDNGESYLDDKAIKSLIAARGAGKTPAAFFSSNAKYKLPIKAKKAYIKKFGREFYHNIYN